MGGKWAVCTIAAKRHLSLGRVVCSSFQRHHSGVPFFLLLCEGRIEAGNEPFRVVWPDELGTGAEAMRSRYNEQEYSYALTPLLMEWVLRQGFDRVLFIKQESMVTGDLTPVAALLETASVALTPHLLRPLTAAAREREILRCGTYNGGLVGCANTEEGGRFLQWWAARVATHCRYDPAAGMHFEQRWLDLAAAYVERLAVVRDPGVNVGHWNLPERAVTVEGERILVDGGPCRLFRFSGYDADRPEGATRYFARLTMENLGAAAVVFARYREELLRAGWTA